MNDLSWKFDYDDGDRIIKVTEPAGRDTRFDYSLHDETKRLLSQARTAADGSRVSQAFDAAGRVVRMTDAAGDVTYVYDDRGHLTKAQALRDFRGTYNYNKNNRLSKIFPYTTT